MRVNPPLEFKGPVTGSIFNLAGQYGVCVTGDHNVTYQIVVATREQADALLAELKEGRHKIEHDPRAVPLPALVLHISPVEKSSPPRWQITARHPSAGPEEKITPTEIPSPRTPQFERDLARFHELAAAALPKAEQRAALTVLASTLGEELTALIPEPERKVLDDLGRAEGPPPFLVIESADDLVLSLPWELLRLGGEWSVRDGRLDLARCVPNPHAGQIEPPTGPVSVYVNVCAPEGDNLPALSHEKESYRISRALQDHPGVRVNEMGEVDDLLEVLCAQEPPTVIHFSGHGGRGVLHFEDEFGGDLKVPVHDLVTGARRKGVQRWPRLFHLSCCHGQTPAQEGSTAGVSSTAASLHREGIPQVIAHFGPVFDSQATDAEAAFYAALAEGRRTREAVRAARQALAAPFAPLLREVQRREDAAPDADGQVPFAWALLVLYHAGADYPLGLPVPRGKEADAPGAGVRRRDEELHAGGRTKVLRVGFIGRRRELHTLRRRLREGKNTLVVQGLGGLGKSVYCWKALALYAERGYLPLPLWCAAAEDASDPARAILDQFNAAVRPLVGERWDGIAEAAARQLPEAGPRLAALLNLLVSQEQAPPVAVYLDNLESLMRRPGHEDYQPDTIGEWRDPGCRAVWTALGRLSRWTRARLVPLLEGHPRAVEFLDGFVLSEQRRWESEEGPLPDVSDEAAAGPEWERFVAPVIEATRQKLREDLLFDALWQQVLRPLDRRLLVRLTVLRRPGERDLVLALAEPSESGKDLQRLRDAGLLEEEIARDPRGGDLARRFEVHAVVAGLARTLAGSDWETWRREGSRLAGDFLDARLKAARQLDAADVLDAGHYLLNAGEADRGFEWFLTLNEWQTGRGYMAQALFTLTPLLGEPTRRALTKQNQMRVSVLVAGCLSGLGQLEPATGELRRAVTLGQELAAADPTNAEWQRDLSVSFQRLGDVQLVQGNLAGAQASFEESRKIIARLAAADPTNAEWQRDLSISYNKLGDVLLAQGNLAGAQASFEEDMKIAARLAAADPTNAEWQRDLSVSYNKLGDVLLAQGNLAGAQASFEESRQIRARLAAADPTNAEWQRDLSVSYNKLGSVQLAQGNLAGAQASFEESRQIRARLAAADPTNAQWQRDLSVSFQRLGDVQLVQGNLAGAQASFEESRKIIARLAAADPTNAQWQADLVVSLVRISSALDTAKPEGREAARSALREAVSIAEKLAAEGRLTSHQQQGWAEDLRRRLAALD